MKHPDNSIFHFTGAGAALSILTRRQLWATDVEYMNDKFEGQLPSRVLSWIVASPEKYLRKTAVTAKHLGALKRSLSYGQIACSVSFSEHYRSLPQFRMYCPPAGGYAVGFPREYLAQIGLLLKCDYSRTHLIEWACAYAKEFIEDASAVDRDDLTEENLCQIVISKKPYIRRRVTAALTFKSDEFINEAELRLVWFGLPKLFREAPERNLIIPYSAIDLPNEPIEVRIVAGPNREPVLASKSVGSLSRAARDSGTVWKIGHLSPGEFGFRA